MTNPVPHASQSSDSPASGDAELVERFIVTHDQAALSELVHRHSAVVLGVCRRYLHDSNDIDDAFLAAFLVLVRNARRVRNRASLASWLYGVAYRLSLSIARSKYRRRETVLLEETLIDEHFFQDLANRHDQQLLDDELNALPERYRQPLVLRYLAGKSMSEVASELGMTVDAVEGRLKRGKNELRSRLLRRGVSLGLTLVAFETTQHAAQAAGIETLIASTIQAGLAWNIGSSLPPTISPVSDRVIEFAGKEIIAMAATTKTTITVGLTLGGLVAGIAGLGASGLFSGPAGSTAVAAGINSILPVVEVIGHQIEMAAIAAEPANLSPEPVAPKAADIDADGKTQTPTTGEATKTAKVAKERWDVKPTSLTRQKIEAELDNQSSAAFLNVQLRDAIEALKVAHGIEILFDKKALDENGTSVEQEVSLNVEGPNLKTILRLLLEPIDLDYIVKDDFLVITTREHAEKQMEIRVYRIDQFGITLFPKDVAEIVTTFISPDDWAQVGSQNRSVREAEGQETKIGDKYSIHVTGNALIIRATQRIHEEINDLVDQLSIALPRGSKN